MHFAPQSSQVLLLFHLIGEIATLRHFAMLRKVGAKCVAKCDRKVIAKATSGKDHTYRSQLTSELTNLHEFELQILEFK